MTQPAAVVVAGCFVSEVPGCGVFVPVAATTTRTADSKQPATTAAAGCVN